MDKIIRSLTHKAEQSIVYRYTSKRNPLDRTSFIPYYISRPNMYHPSRKPKLSQWDDPSVQWPKLLPKPTVSADRQLIIQLEKEYMEKVIYQRNFQVEKFRAGDVVSFTLLHSLSEQKGNDYVGLCIGTKRMNSLNASFRVLVRFCGCMIEIDVKLYSPMISEFKVVAKGDPAHAKAKMYWLADMDLTKEQLQIPIVKNSKKKKQKKHDVVLNIESTKQYYSQNINDPLLQIKNEDDEIQESIQTKLK